ncbi:Fcf2 pre-rRNA processing-domain-containing protein [Lophiotrema nucula]|uniref:Fcf2 pre-rRNA processing-domain-containing protein n=1 Tax=Lophiotrema nucula TaxID=690887 RepID=A0A6A5YMF7_9PLEO|nr:Fcf2 pre-rRNA processing-domain-containing protein [Lophiotrema nucula]
MALPAHNTSREDDTDGELSPEDIRQLLSEAEARMRNKQQPASQSSNIKLPRLQANVEHKYLKSDGTIDQSKLVNENDRVLADRTVKKIEDPAAYKKKKLEEKKATAGTDWYNLPRTELTPELRRDLQLLKMRGVLDTKRFYKKTDSKSDVPAFSQVGQIIEGPTEYYTGRINNKDRKRTFVEEVLAQEEQTGKFKKKYNEIQKMKTSGKKAFYNALKAKRKGQVEKR